METRTFLSEDQTSKLSFTTTLQSSLKLLNDSFLCAICKEIYSTPVIITVCSHNFCSICIRRYFTIKQECPLCGQEATTASLVPNRVLETLIKHFNNFKCILKSVFNKPTCNGKFVNLENFKTDDVVTQIPVSNRGKRKSSGDVVDLTELEDEENSRINKSNGDAAPDTSQVEATPLFSLGLKEFCTQSQGFPTQSKREEKPVPIIAESENDLTSNPHNVNSTSDQPSTNGSINGTATQPSQEPKRADCPVCGIKVPTSQINTHLDSCLAREEKKNSLRKNTPKRLKRNNPPTAKLAYNLLSLRDLRKKLKEIGLPTNGDKNDLKRRHQEFLVKYQAEMDKTEPRAVSVLIDELKREEASKKEMEKKQFFMGKLSPTKSVNVDIANRQHLRHHAKQYEELEEIAEKSLPKKRRKINTERKLFEEEVSTNEVETTNSELASSNPDTVEPNSYPSLVSGNEGLLFNVTTSHAEERNGDESPELYVDEPCTSGMNTSNLRLTVEGDSQAEEIKNYIDASLSETY